MNIPRWQGWHLIGQFPEGDPDGVGSWLLHNDGEAVLLEVPPGLTVDAVRAALAQTRSRLVLVTASHRHEDHLDRGAWTRLRKAFPSSDFLTPAHVEGRRWLGGEPLWLLPATKHSLWDCVTVFRGVAMTGDIELGTLCSVNDEVEDWRKKMSMEQLAEFCDRADYHVHSIVSAHLNDVRTDVDWESLFSFEPALAR